MVSFKTILVPTDFSNPAKKALSYGLTLANQFSAKVIIAHIVSGTDKLSNELDHKVRNDIQDLVTAARVGQPNVHIVVKAGPVETSLLGIVADKGVDLVVMGTHGRRNPGRWFIGSVTEHLLRKLPVPLLTVSHLEDETHMTGLVDVKRVLYATDRSEASNKGLRHAIELARATGAQLTMIHAVYYADQMLWAPAGIPFLEDERIRFNQEMRSSADEILNERGLSNFPIETLVVEGKPFEKILQIAEERKTDIIVLNLQSRSTLDRAFLGSTAERVVRLAHIPVLSIPLANATPKGQADECATESTVSH